MKKILIVEDHPDLRKALKTQVELMGFLGITAENGKDGIDTAIAERPDLIMMDFSMPEMDGLEATRILRAGTETKEIAIIAVTAMSDIQSCIEAGCNDYILKPFPIEELRKRSTRSFSRMTELCRLTCFQISLAMRIAGYQWGLRALESGLAFLSIH